MRIRKENLVMQLQLQNEKALEYLVMEHGERLVSIIRKHLFTLPHLQQECLLSTICKIWDYAAYFHEDNEFENWIGSVARYCCLEFLRAYQAEATISWLIEKEIAEEQEMMKSCLKPEEREAFVNFYECKDIRDSKMKYKNMYELLNLIDTDIFEYEKERLTIQEKQDILQKIQVQNNVVKRRFSLKRVLKATEIPLSEEKPRLYFPQKFFLYERR
ncbi:MAG: hypothetical protein HFI69_00195 [Lachnospiraceae bacterium]|nr:hypothetical protein [Lachnospiraceae bacterium]